MGGRYYEIKNLWGKNIPETLLCAEEIMCIFSYKGQ